MNEYKTYYVCEWGTLNKIVEILLQRFFSIMVCENGVAKDLMTCAQTVLLYWSVYSIYVRYIMHRWRWVWSLFPIEVKTWMKFDRFRLKTVYFSHDRQFDQKIFELFSIPHFSANWFGCIFFALFVNKTHEKATVITEFNSASLYYKNQMGHHYSYQLFDRSQTECDIGFNNFVKSEAEL